MTSMAALPVRHVQNDRVVVIDEIERTALLFRDDDAADLWCTTGHATYLRAWPASDEELEDALGAHLGTE